MEFRKKSKFTVIILTFIMRFISTYIGLFGFARGATIHNVELSNIDIKDEGCKGHSIAPIVAIALDSKIEDCTFD